jgi:hypothetical protein
MDSDGPFQLRQGLSCDRLCERGAASFAQLPAACHTESKEGELFVTARTLLCALVLVTTNAFARPVQFTSTLRTNNDLAVNGSTADFQTGQSPPSALPLITTALSFGAVDFASASSVNAPGLLNTSAEADSNRGFASSDATAEFFRYLRRVAGRRGGNLLGSEPHRERRRIPVGRTHGGGSKRGPAASLASVA